jgi:hypothetical protein
MKRLHCFGLWILMFALIGCDATSATTHETTTDETTTTGTISATTTEVLQFEGYIGYASGLLITQTVLPNEIQWPGLSFHAHYSDVMVMPVARSVCVTANIEDYNFRGATYYLVGRYTGATLEETRYVFTTASSSRSYEACFTGIDLSRHFEILLAKKDTDVPQAHSALYSVVTLDLHDPRANERGVVYSAGATIEDTGYVTSDSTPSIRYQTAFLDSKRTIDSIAFLLVDKSTQAVVQTQVLEIVETMFEGDLLNLPVIAFVDLAPGTEYTIKTRISGNDGIDDFEDLSATTIHTTSSTYEGLVIQQSQHDLYGAITALSAVDGTVIVHIKVVNDTGNEHGFVAEVHTSDLQQNDHLTTFDLQEGANVLSLEAAVFSFGGVLYIRDTTTNKVVSRRVIDVRFNYYSVNYVYGRNGLLTIEVLNGETYTETRSCRLEIYSANGTLLDTISMQAYRPGTVFTVLSSAKYQDHPGIYGKVVYQVPTEIGLITHEALLTLVPW